MMMMFSRRRASPKHRYDIIEVDYGGGGHRTRLIDLKDQLLLCLEVRLPPYIKEQGGGGGRPGGGAPGGVLLPPGVGLPPFLVQVGEGKEGREEKKERGAPTPLLVLFRLEGEGARGLPWPPLLFSTLGSCGPLTPRGVPVTPGTPVYIR